MPILGVPLSKQVKYYMNSKEKNLQTYKIPHLVNCNHIFIKFQYAYDVVPINK